MAGDQPVRLRVGTLCGRPVFGEDGRIGIVMDVRVVQDGPMKDGINNSFRVDGLVVGRGQFVERLGLFRHRIRGPLLLRLLDRLVGPERKYVPWTQLLDPLALAGADEPVRFEGPTADLP